MLGLPNQSLGKQGDFGDSRCCIQHLMVRRLHRGWRILASGIPTVAGPGRQRWCTEPEARLSRPGTLAFFLCATRIQPAIVIQRQEIDRSFDH